MHERQQVNLRLKKVSAKDKVVFKFSTPKFVCIFSTQDYVIEKYILITVKTASYSRSLKKIK